MPGKVWDNTIHSDGISTVLTKEARSSATTILRQMMMLSCMATIGIVSVQQIPISIHPPHNGRRHSRTQRIMQVGAVAMLIHSNISYAKRKKNDKKDVLFYNMLSSTDSKEIVKMLQEHVGKNVAEITDKFSTLLIDSTDGLFNEKLHSLRKSLSSVKKYKVILKSLRRREIICLRRTDVAVAVRLSTPFHLLHNALFQLYYSLLRICRPSLEHVDNNFLPIDPNDAELFRYFRGKVVILMNEMAGNFAELNLGDGEEIQKECSALKHEISDFRDKMMVNIQTQNCDITATTLLLHLLQELEQILHEIDRLIYNMRKFSRLASETPSKQ